ncbi:MAG TPA: hypothetical protein VJ870_11070 [Amycolatopsis sp.]|nr:hypothetical protein [Amycolatopsis sp.]
MTEPDEAMTELPPEADPADVAEQQRDLGDFDEDDEEPDHE